MEKINELIIKANKFFQTLSTNVSTKEQKSEWFMTLVFHIVEVFRTLRELQRNGTVKNHEHASIYLDQLISILAFLIKVFVEEIKAEEILLEARFYVINQIQYCLKGFQEDLMDDNDDYTDNLLGSFIKLVDYSLDKIGDIYDSDSSPEELLGTYTEIKEIFTEVLTHAMIIGQISLDEDLKIIEGSCQSAIEALDWLFKEINKQNPSMINLAVQACSDKICILERRVNNAVLKLTLKIFSEYTELLDKIQEFCFDFSNADKPTTEFASLIEAHDFQVDRIIQIGLFSVSCSTDKINAVKIKSCLTLLESLESELIPSFTSVLRKQTKQSIQLAGLFKELWIRQVGLLKGFVFHIVDPYAFCQLVYNENKEILSNYYRNLQRRTNNNRKSILENTEPIKKVITYSKLLLAVIETVKNEKTQDSFKKAYQNFKDVLNEVKSIYVLVMEKKDVKIHIKTWKRCRILQTTISDLKDYLIEEDTEQISISAFNSINESLYQKENSVKDPISGNPFLRHVINRGREILKDRSNLHSPSEFSRSLKIIKKIATKKLKEVKYNKREMPLSKYVHLRRLSFLNTTASNNTATNSTQYGELEFSDIILELNNLTKSFIDITSKNEI